MNKFSGHINAIEVSNSMSLVSIGIGNGLVIKSIVIENPETAGYLVVGHAIEVLFKETEVVLGTELNPSISLQNQIPGVVRSIEKGTLISSVQIDSDAGFLESVVSTHAVETLHLKSGSRVVAMIKLNEVMLSA